MVGTPDDYELSPGALDDIFVFWRCGNERRAVYTWDYTKTSDYAGYLLERRFHISRTALAGRVGELRAAGNVLALEHSPHVVGIMRPWILGEPTAVRQSADPFLIAYDPDDGRWPWMPVVSAAREDSVKFVRSLQQHDDLDPRHWRRFHSEQWLSPLNKLLNDLTSKRSNWPTELERLIGGAERRSTKRAA